MKKRQEEDPFLKLGVGIVMYRKLLRSLVILFFVLSLMTWPVLSIYKKGGAYGDMVFSSKYAEYSLGNMGFESQQCAFTPLTMSKLYLHCEYGSITSVSTNGYGINTFDQQIRDACVKKPEFHNEHCSGMLNDDYIHNQFTEYCKGKSTCYIKTLSKLSGQIEEKLINKTMVGDDLASLYENEDPPQYKDDEFNKCVDSRNAFFFQYSCEEPPDATYAKYEKLSLVACIFCFVCVVYSLTIYYLKANTNLQIVQFDL